MKIIISCIYTFNQNMLVPLYERGFPISVWGSKGSKAKRESVFK